MAEAKRIAILTSGGDCAGLNAVLRAVVFRAQGYGWRVIGVHQGTHGLLNRPVDAEELDPARFDGNLLRQGGTILGTTNYGDPFAYPMPDGAKKDRSGEVIEGYRALGAAALIGVGGDGSFAILRKLAQQGAIPLVGIPKTIDNDVGLTENSIGYSTAVDVATEALDRLQPTAASHSRVMVLEVMGRDAGHIAIGAGIAGGADAILIPEIPYTMAGLKAKIEAVRASGRNFALVVVAEAVPREDGAKGPGIGQYFGERIAEETGAETRVTVLGHVQRGGTPSARDRLFAAAFGVHAVDLIAAGKFDRMVAWQSRGVTDVALADAIASYHIVDPHGALVHTAQGLGIYMGEVR